MNDEDTDLLVRARTGDRAALEELLVRHAPAARRAIQINIKWRSVLEPDDVLQTAYLEAFLDFDGFRGDADALPSWLATIARHATLDAVRELERRKRPQPEQRVNGSDGLSPLEWLFVQTTGSTPSGVFQRDEIARQLEQEIEALPRQYAEVLRLRYFQQSRVTDIARLLGVSEGAVHLRLNRAIKQLRKLFIRGTSMESA